jgi:hypothetical protein
VFVSFERLHDPQQPFCVGVHMKINGRQSITLMLAVALAAVLSSLTPVHSNSKTTKDMPLSELIEDANRTIERYWQWTAASMRLRISSPRLISITNGAATPCGPLRDAFYCAANNTIYYDYQFMNRLYSNIGDYAVVTVLAHEWGHCVQAQVVRVRLPSIAIENQADCFAGNFTRYAESQRLLDSDDWDEALEALFLGGDVKGTPVTDENAHGKPIRRVDVFRFGYHTNSQACFCECIRDSLRQYYGRRN